MTVCVYDISKQPSIESHTLSLFLSHTFLLLLLVCTIYLVVVLPATLYTIVVIFYLDSEKKITLTLSLHFHSRVRRRVVPLSLILSLMLSPSHSHFLSVCHVVHFAGPAVRTFANARKQCRARSFVFARY